MSFLANLNNIINTLEISDSVTDLLLVRVKELNAISGTLEIEGREPDER